MDSEGRILQKIRATPFSPHDYALAILLCGVPFSSGRIGVNERMNDTTDSGYSRDAAQLSDCFGGANRPEVVG